MLDTRVLSTRTFARGSHVHPARWCACFHRASGTRARRPAFVAGVGTLRPVVRRVWPCVLASLGLGKGLRVGMRGRRSKNYFTSLHPARGCEDADERHTSGYWSPEVEGDFGLSQVRQMRLPREQSAFRRVCPRHVAVRMVQCTSQHRSIQNKTTANASLLCSRGR